MENSVVCSVVIPVYNEEEVVNECYSRIKKVMDSKGLKFKMLIVEKRKKQKSFCEEILIDEIEKIKTIV